MGQNSKIQWTHHTFNPWRGCVEVSEGCDHCYAREQAKRNPTVLGRWGAGEPRVLASEEKWREPEKWNREAMAAGVRARVFCASIADVFERQDQEVQMTNAQGGRVWLQGFEEEPYLLRHARERLWRLISHTGWLHWLLLTKRPEHVLDMLPEGWVEGGTNVDAVARQREQAGSYPMLYDHVWFGTTVENQARAEERVPHLLNVPCRLRFLSLEPLLGRVDLHPWLEGGRIGWVIVGGESGGGARAFDVDWVEEVVATCQSHGVPVFVKQFGSRPVAERRQVRLIDRKGGDPEEWPDNLRVREVPVA